MLGYAYHCFPGLDDRYLGPEVLEKVLYDFEDIATVSQIGISVSGRPIFGLKLGKGPSRILMWSQMHGNESTTTRALLDLLLGIKRDDAVQQLIAKFTLYLIPMLNPDGAYAYTRNNANDVDLNRDAQARTQPEIQCLFAEFETFKPHYCFNLHDQRTRYGVGQPPVPSSISFLSPAADPEKSVTPARHSAMQIIIDIVRRLHKRGRIGIGRYDDTFNANCIGDTFVALGVPSILFEAGFIPADYNRQKTREWVYYALLAALEAIASEEGLEATVDAYFEIPENSSCFADIVLKNAYPGKRQADLVLNFQEELHNGSIRFVPQLLKEDYAESYIGHVEYDLQLEKDKEKVMSDPQLNKFIE